MDTNKPALRVRINWIDHILAPPSQLDNLKGKHLARVPIIRIFGDSSTGQKACVHVHQVYPYIYVEYKGSLIPSDVNQFVARFSVSLDHAVALSLKRNPTSRNSKFIRAIFLVKGVHFYGFHSSYTPFLKIFVADPTLITRIVTIIQSGTVMKTAFRVFESHLSFALQFMCDFGLYGCGWLDLGSEIWQRGKNSIHEDEQANIFPSSPLFCQSRMPLEVDVSAHQILNRHQLSSRDIHHELTISAPPLPLEPLVTSVRELWEDERKRRSELGLSSNPEVPTELSEKSRGKGGEWVAEARWWEAIHERIRREKHQIVQDHADIEWTRWVMTTFESVECLWESRWRKWRPQVREVVEQNPFDDREATNRVAEVDIDASMLSSQEMSWLVEGEEAKWLDKEVLEGNNSIKPPGADEELDNDEDSEDPFVTPQNSPKEINKPNLSVKRLSLTPSKGERQPSQSSSPSATPTKHINAPPSSLLDRSLNGFGENQEASPSSCPELSFTHSQTLASTFSQASTAIYPSTLRPAVTFFATQTNFDTSYVYARPPPNTSFLLSTLAEYDIPPKLYQDPYYSNEKDAVERSREYAGLMYRLKGGSGLATLDAWDEKSKGKEIYTLPELDSEGIGGWEYAGLPPSICEVKRWLKQEKRLTQVGSPIANPALHSQIEGPTQFNIYGLKSTPLAMGKDRLIRREKQNMSILAMEIFALSRENLLADPAVDALVAAFYAFQDDHAGKNEQQHTGIIVVDDPQLNSQRLRNVSARTFYETMPTELELLNRITDVVIEFDPDIVVGWEIQNSSWSYIQARGAQYGLDIGELISRASSNPHVPNTEQWDTRTQSTFKVIGRHVLNIWRILRAELALSSYTFENVAFHVLGCRTPYHSPATLTSWYQSQSPSETSRMMKYLAKRTSMNLTLLEESEIISKNAEFARVFGVDFFSVLSRGSQFKVESFMFRIAKPENFVLLSPSKAEVGKQNAAECIPLVMEPQSAFYNSPLVVLDFQSLYPSIMIAYNYCYSTCIGRVVDFQGRPKLGVTDVPQPPGLVEKLKNHIQVSPNGLMYVKPSVRTGLLSKMLTELLDTRVMVKQAMKSAKSDKALKRILNARQLGLKFIANVTYGYTSAAYSGRMPAIEIADSIVQSGRETLEKAIEAIESTKHWGAKVVYGDTDSLFIYLQGKTKEQAFRIGYEMADVITAMNPAPVKLKFEKVYLPCVLMAKKRYVGFKFESPDEVEPTFDAKGIETVRRDGIPAQRKMVENCLKILFRTQDLSKVKAYCYRSWMKILENRASIQDFIFAKEVRMGTYSDKGPPPPGVMVAARRAVLDEYNEAQYGERIPYVIIRGEDKSRLVERAVAPDEFLQNQQMQLDAIYYITRVLIPPLERIFNLVGANVRRWYDEMLRNLKPEQTEPKSPSRQQHPDIATVNIQGHFGSSRCLICDTPESEGLCESCENDPQTTISSLLSRISAGEKRLLDVRRICISCTGAPVTEDIGCESLDCPWLFERVKSENKIEFLQALQEMVDDFVTTTELEPQSEVSNNSDSDREEEWTTD